MKILTTPRMERCIGCHSCSWPAPAWCTSGFPGTRRGFGSGRRAACPPVRGQALPGLRPGALRCGLPHRRL